MKAQQLRSYIINTLFLSGFFVAIVAAFLKYDYFKAFHVHIETSCDPAIEKCFHRDCANDPDCPPNNLDDYRQFDLPGSLFATCSEVDGCASVCKSGKGLCTEVVCGDTPDDVCSDTIKN